MRLTPYFIGRNEYSRIWGEKGRLTKRQKKVYNNAKFVLGVLVGLREVPEANFKP